MPNFADGRRRRWTLAIVSLTQLLAVLDGTIVGVALPQAQLSLGMSDAQRQWVVTAYALAFGSLLLLGGRVADFAGRKRSFLIGLAGFAAASTWGGLARTGAELLAARGVQGAFAALMAPAALAILSVTFPTGHERNTAFAIFGSVAGAGSAVGLVLGGVLTEFLDWRWCLLVNVPFVVVGGLIGIVVLKENRVAGRRKYDVLGALTVTAGFGMLVSGITLVDSPSWGVTGVVAGVAGLALLGAFLVIERGADDPLLPLKILTDRVRASAISIQALTGAAMVAVMLYVTFHLQLVLGFPPVFAGLATLPVTVAIMSAVPFGTRMLNRVGPRRQLIGGPLLAALGASLLARVSVGGSYLSEMLPGLVVFGVGMGFTFVPLQNLALRGVASDDAGAAAAASNATNQVGGALGLAVVTNLYLMCAGATSESNPSAMVAGHRAVFVAASVILVLVAVLAAVFIHGRSLTSSHDGGPAVETAQSDESAPHPVASVTVVPSGKPLRRSPRE